MTGPATSTWTGHWRQGLCYGAPGLPLAFAALPLYVVLPNHYAAQGVPLAWLGALLLAARLLDAVADPWIGRLADRWLARSRLDAWHAAALAAGAIAVGFHALFTLPNDGAGMSPVTKLAWCGAGLLVTCGGYSVLGIVHQAWGARLGGDALQRARIAAWREGLGLVGVLTACVLPSVLGLSATAWVLAAALAVAMVMFRQAPRAPADTAPRRVNASPLRDPAFRRLLAVYLLNGIGSAVPATLVLFFIRDRLQAAAMEPLFLLAYFAAGALSVPAWVRIVRRLGLARSWMLGMALSIAVFAGTAWLGPGDTSAFMAICVLSGLGLGADLTLPGALLAGVVQRSPGRAEGAYVGWWTFATKLNLALAAGLALPLLQWFGYAPGRHDADALGALAWGYGLLPCLLKSAGLLLLGFFCLRHTDDGAFR
jgi:GPH family glycoside/pentoside/hexuronide:cation symporter